MQEYTSKETLVEEIQKMAALFIGEFEDIPDGEGDIRLAGVDRTPCEMLAYQLGWMGLLRSWDNDELAGKQVAMPAPGCKWNQMGVIYQGFYETYGNHSLAALRQLYQEAVADLVVWLQGFSPEELFQPGGRKWAQATPANWPVWKWVHINTAAPFKTFRSKIRKWKKLRAAQAG